MFLFLSTEYEKVKKSSRPGQSSPRPPSSPGASECQLFSVGFVAFCLWLLPHVHTYFKSSVSLPTKGHIHILVCRLQILLLKQVGLAIRMISQVLPVKVLSHIHTCATCLHFGINIIYSLLWYSFNAAPLTTPL